MASSSFIEFIQHAQCLVEHRSLQLFKQSESYFTKLRKQDSSVDLCIQILQLHTLPFTGAGVSISTVYLIASQTLSYACSSKQLSSATILALVRLVVGFARSDTNMQSVVYKHLKLALCQVILNDVLVAVSSSYGAVKSYSLSTYYINLRAALQDISLDPIQWTDILTSLPEQMSNKEFIRFSKQCLTSSSLSLEMFCQCMYQSNLPYILTLAQDNLVQLHASGRLLFGGQDSSLVTYHDRRCTEQIGCVLAWSDGYLRLLGTVTVDPVEGYRQRHDLYQLLTTSTHPSSSGSSLSPLQFALGFLQASYQCVSLSALMAAAPIGDLSSGTAHYPLTLELCQDFLRVMTQCVFGVSAQSKDSLDSTPMPMTALRSHCSDMCEQSSTAFTSGCAIAGQILPFLRTLLGNCRSQLAVNIDAVESHEQSSILHALTTVCETLTPLLPLITLSLTVLDRSSMHTEPVTTTAATETLQLFSALLRDLLEIISTYTQLVGNAYSPSLSANTRNFDSENFETFLDSLSTPIEIVSSIFTSYVQYSSSASLLKLEKQTMAAVASESSVSTDFTSQTITTVCELLQVLVRVSVLPACLSRPNQHHFQTFLASSSAFEQVYEKFNVFRNDIRDFIRELCQCCPSTGSNPFTPFIVGSTTSAIEQIFGLVCSLERTTVATNTDADAVYATIYLLESQLHICTSISRTLCSEMVQGSVTSFDHATTLLYLISHSSYVSLAPVARLAAVLIGDLLLAYREAASKHGFMHVTAHSRFSSTTLETTVTSYIIPPGGSVQMTVAELCARCCTAAMMCLRFTESVTDDRVHLLAFASVEYSPSTQLQSPLQRLSNPTQILPFRIKQDHIGAVAVLKLASVFTMLLNTSTDRPAVFIASESESSPEEHSAVSLVLQLMKMKWSILGSSNFFCDMAGSQVSRVMTLKSFLLLHEASLAVYTHSLVVDSATTVDDPSTCTMHFGRLFGNQLGPLAVASMAALCLLSSQHQVDQDSQMELVPRCDDLLTRLFSTFYSHTSTSTDAQMDLQRQIQLCMQRGLNLPLPNISTTAAATIMSKGYSGLLDSLFSDLTEAVNMTALIRMNTPLRVVCGSLDLLIQSLDIISKQLIQSLREGATQHSQATQNAYQQAFCSSFRHVWLPFVQLLLSQSSAIHQPEIRAELMPRVCNLLGTLIVGLVPSHPQTQYISDDLQWLLTSALPSLTLDIISNQLWLSPECLSIATSFIRGLLEWGSSVDVSGVVLAYYDQVCALVSTALHRAVSPASSTGSIDSSTFSQSDLIFAQAVDFWTACVSYTRLSYICPVPSLTGVGAGGGGPPSITQKPSTKVSIRHFRDYSHFIATIVDTLCGYVLHRAHILWRSTGTVGDDSDGVLDEHSTWERVVALLASFANKPVFDTMLPDEELLFTQYLKDTFESPRLGNILRTVIFGICGMIPSTQREGLTYVLYSLFGTFTPDAAALALLPVMTDESAAWVFQSTVSSENSRQALAQQLRMHVSVGNIKGFKTSLKVLSRKK